MWALQTLSASFKQSSSCSCTWCSMNRQSSYRCSVEKSAQKKMSWLKSTNSGCLTRMTTIASMASLEKAIPASLFFRRPTDKALSIRASSQPSLCSLTTPKTTCWWTMSIRSNKPFLISLSKSEQIVLPLSMRVEMQLSHSLVLLKSKKVRQ